MTKRLAVVGLLVVLLWVVGVLIWPVQAGPPGQGPGEGPPIYLRSRTVVARPGLDPALQGVAAAQAGERIHVLLQLDHIPSPQERAALAAQGIDLQVYVPEQAWIAAVPAADVAALATQPGVHWVGAWRGGDKLSPLVQAGDFPAWAVHPSGRVQLMVLLHTDVALAAGEALVAAHGGIVAGSLSTPPALTAWMMPADIPALAAEEGVLWVEEGPPPLSATNDGARAALNVDELQAGGLTGSGVKLFVFDAGTVETTHQAFTGRLTVIDAQPKQDHPTHVAGTAAGSGSGSPGGRNLKGVAPAATIFSAGYQQFAGTTLFWDNAGDIENDYAVARNVYGVDLGTNSIGSNTAANGYNCAIEGDYGVSSALIDGIVRGDNTEVGSGVIMTWANGNERSGGTPRGRCGSHFFTTAPPSCAKNPIHVGATNSDGKSMTNFSSWGPCDDGRLKPTVTGPGCESGLVNGETYIYSALLGNTYGGSGWCGTSMATPAVAGVATLAIQQYRITTGNAAIRPPNALMKAWMIHTAQDQGQAGPDYIYGYGHVDGARVINLITSTTKYRTDAISTQGEVDTFTYNVPPGSGEFKVSLVWDDYAATPIISNAAPALVNDLDLEIVAPDGSTIFYPFSLDPANPEKAATATARNSRDNQEQVIVKNPVAGNWTIKVKGTTVPQAAQSYALVHTHAPVLICGSELVTNGGFETGSSGWTLDSSSPVAAVVAAPAGGSGQALRLGSAVSNTDFAYQAVTIPAAAKTATLAFDWYLASAEAEPDAAYDFFKVLVYNSAHNAVLRAVDVRSNAWKRGKWYGSTTIDLSSYAGQTVNIHFEGTNDSLYVTSFYLDGVSLQTCQLAASLSIDKTVAAGGTAPFQRGTAITYTIVVANNSAIDAPTVHITDTLPGLIGGANLDVITAINAAKSVTYTINATVAANAPLLVKVTNTAYYSHTGGTGQASAAFTVQPKAKLFLPVVLKQ